MSQTDVEGLDKDPSISVRYPEEFDGGYMGYVESIHLLHCLDLLRQMTWKDHYSDNPYFTDPPLMLRAHVGKYKQRTSCCTILKDI